MTALDSAHVCQLESARQKLFRQQERDRQHNETVLAKHIQKETGCTWSQAIGAVINNQRTTGE